MFVYFATPTRSSIHQAAARWKKDGIFSQGNNKINKRSLPAFEKAKFDLYPWQ